MCAGRPPFVVRFFFGGCRFMWASLTTPGGRRSRLSGQSVGHEDDEQTWRVDQHSRSGGVPSNRSLAAESWTTSPSGSVTSTLDPAARTFSIPASSRVVPIRSVSKFSMPTPKWSISPATALPACRLHLYTPEGRPMRPRRPIGGVQEVQPNGSTSRPVSSTMSQWNRGPAVFSSARSPWRSSGRTTGLQRARPADSRPSRPGRFRDGP